MGAAFEPLSSISDAGAQLERVQNYLIASDMSSLRFWDIADSDSPQEHWATSLPGDVRDIVARNQTVVVLHDHGLAVFALNAQGP